MSLLHVAIIVPFLWAVLTPLLSGLLRRAHTGWLVLPVPAVLFVWFLLRIPEITQGKALRSSVEWMPSLGIDFTACMDGLGLLFALLITGIGTLVVLYSIFYLDKSKESLRHFYVYLLLFMGAMLGVVLSDNLMVLYGFWELTSVSSFLLIAFWHTRDKSRYGAQKSLLITVFGGLAMFAGFLLLYAMTGTFSIRETIAQAHDIAGQTLFVPAMLLILLGAFTKSAQFPFHIWLPDAMEAPTPVSAYLHSATMVKAGIYLVARLSPVFAGQAEWFWIVSGFGLATLVYGSATAIRQTDLKAMLAYSTISQLGLVMSLLGLGSASAFFAGAGDSLLYAKATAAAVFHLINHAVFKGALFMAVGIVDHETGTRDLRRLGGLMRLMPITFTVALIGTFSMAGLPPFSGFLSKEMFFTAMLNVQRLDLWSLRSWGVVFPAVAWAASVFTFVYSMIVLLRTFAGKLQSDKLGRKPHEAPLGMLIPPVVLASCAVVFGLFPNLLAYSLLEPAMAAILPDLLAQGERFHVSIRLWHGWTPEVFMTIGVVLAGAALYKLYGRLNVLQRPKTGGLWLNRLYDGGLGAAETFAYRLTARYMTGSVRHYLIYIFVFFGVALGAALLLSNGIRFDTSRYAPVSFYEAAAALVMTAAAVAVPFANSRLTAIILTGAVGYMVTLFFILFRAPDLALTQIIVETVSVALFLLCFYHLPKWKKEAFRPRFKLFRFLVAAGAGAIVTLIALGTSSGGSFESISHYYVEESYRLAGGKNIVNVILVDFRGFDTMLEITVLGIASLGIYALVKLRLDPPLPRKPAEVERANEKTAGGTLAGSNDVLLKTISRAVVFIMITFALYLFFAGHNHPGGGFIGALMTASALLLLAIAFGTSAFRGIVPVDFRKLTAAGLAVAFLTGIGSFAFGAPFLSHAFGHFHLPILGDTELATAVLFDLGVYLSVVGVAMTILLTIGRDS